MELRQIYRPIEKELRKVEEVLESCLKESRNQSILRINNFLLEARGKRIRPALVILSAKASLSSACPCPSRARPTGGEKRQTGEHQSSAILQQAQDISSKDTRQSGNVNHQLIKIASAMELIHMASLIHDDVIDNSYLRHHKPTVNSKWGEDVSIALGDYLYSVAFELISQCNNTDILQCISSATKAMCEGELLQVCERGNVDLLKQRYIVIVKKKTASLFAASCQAGALVSNPREPLHSNLKEYGLNFGIAFQIIDDCLDLVGREEVLGKTTGADLRAGELTLPLLYLLDKADVKESEEIKKLLSLSRQDKDAFNELRGRLTSSSAILKAKKEARFYTERAKDQLDGLGKSPLKRGLLDLADYIIAR